jgi:hypothetical protein
MKWWWMRCPILTTATTTLASGLVFVVFIFVNLYGMSLSMMYLEYPFSKKYEVPVYLHFGGTAWHCVKKKCFSSCSVSVTFCFGSGSADPYYGRTDPNPALFVSDNKDNIKKTSRFLLFTF